jgi:predicted secreted acid phosphatase
MRALACSALVVGLSLSGSSAVATADEPDAPATPAAIVAYRDSGEWEADLARVAQRAQAYLDENAERTDGRRPALVLDIDDTALSNYDCLREADFERSALGPCTRGGELPAIPQVLALFQHARAEGIAVLFITRRRQRAREVTVRNLREAGYADYEALMMCPNRETRREHATCKIRARKRAKRRGIRIVANVGDQRSDLTGGHALRGFKLPNPMYLTK